MDLYASNLVQHIKRTVCSSIRLGYQYACDYPVILGVGILLLFLHRLCPSLFMFLLSSSPVFLLTALLLGALLTYGGPCAPVIGVEALGSQHILSPKSKTSATDCSTKEIENVAVAAYAEKSFESQVVCIKERTLDSVVYDSHHDEEKATSMSTDMILCAEDFSEFANINVIVETEERQQQQSLLVPSNVIVKTEEQAEQNSENVELQEFENANAESCHNEVHNRYQLGELMSSCWQPVMRQDPCSDSESDISGSSSDASMTDIIPMLDELNPPINLGAHHPSSTLRDSFNSSSDDEDDSEEDGDLGSDVDGAKGKNSDENNSVDNNDADSSDVEKVSNVNSLMERRRTKNILKFELDKMLMDMQAADTTQKMEAASCFRVQVPSISTPRPKPFDPSNGSEETIELPQIPDSAPSILLRSKKSFDIPFDQIVDRERKLQETWTPRSYFPSTQHRKHGNFDKWQFSYLQQHNSVMAEKHELSRSDSCDSRSDSDSEQTGNNGKLFGSLEAHIGEEIKIISAAISDVCVLEADCEVDEGGEQLTLHSLSKGNNSEQHIGESDSISEVNLLFKSRMEEVLVQSISESGISQPVLTVKHEDELCGALSADSETPVLEASSVEELNSRIPQITKETPAPRAASDRTCDNELVQDRSSAALPAENGHSSQLPIEEGHNSGYTLDDPTAVRFEGKPNELFVDYSELPVLEASSVEEMNSSFKKIKEEVQDQIYPISVHKSVEDEGDTSSDMLVLEAKSIEDISSAFGQLRNGHDIIKLSQNITSTNDGDDQEHEIQGTSGGGSYVRNMN